MGYGWAMVSGGGGKKLSATTPQGPLGPWGVNSCARDCVVIARNIASRVTPGFIAINKALLQADLKGVWSPCA